MLTQRRDGGGIDLWRAVQQWKAISLSDLLWSSQSYIPDSSVDDAESRNLMNQEKILVDKIEIAEPYDRPDLRRKLREHWIKMSSYPSFSTFSAMKLGMGATVDHLKQIQLVSKRAGLENNAIIFVDWTRHRDSIILFAVRCSSKRQTFNYWRLPLTYPDIEDWIVRKMREKVPGSTGPLRRKEIRTADDLLELTSLIDPLHQMIEGDELLVLCPSGILNEIPLHAIHFRGREDPLITTNPIVYSSSHAIMKSCIDSALRMVDSDELRTKFAAFGRYGDLDATEDHLIKEMVVDLAEQFEGVHTTGEDLKRDKFKNITSGAAFIHYHGHATCELDTSMRALLLQPDPENEDDGRFVIDDIFQLQLQSPHVTILACASGEQDFSVNDDPFGIVTAFLCAGATSVAGTLWPTNCRDARDFCDLFYDQLKQNSGPVMNMAKAMQKTVLTLREDWNFDDPFH